MPLVSPDVWYRASKGRVFQFEIQNEALLQVLQSSLPDKYRPYALVAWQMRKAERGYVEECDVLEVPALPLFLEKGIWDYFIVSTYLTDLKIHKRELMTTQCLATSGLVNLQHGRIQMKAKALSSIGIVVKIQNHITGEIRTHVQYLETFDRLKQAIQRALVGRLPRS